MDRRADLDWLRVIAFGLLILYHAGLPWTGWGWHLNSSEILPWLTETMRFTNRWRIPLIYMVAGGAVGLALAHRGAGAFAIDRVRRLALPLAFGVLVIVPPQIYLERYWNGEFTGSFLEWLPEAYIDGNLAWVHLWFVGYILVLSFALLPVFVWMRTPAGQLAQARLAHAMARTSLHWLMAVPLAIAMLALGPISRNAQYLIGDWYGIGLAALLMLYGDFVFNTPEMMALLRRQCWRAAVVGCVTFLVLDVVIFHLMPGERVRLLGAPVYAPLSAINMIAWLFAVIGLGSRYLRQRPAFLAQATEALYPFYILHQTVTVAAVYVLLTFRVPGVPGYLLSVLATFGGTWLIYAWGVRPCRWVRPLFGMKPLAPRRPSLARPDGGPITSRPGRPP